MVWDANVTILSGPDVLLVIDPNGKVIEDENVTVTDGEGGPTRSTAPGNNMITSGTAVVKDIAPVSGQADFYANDGVSNTSTYPLLTFDDTFNSITILNESDNNLDIHNITTYDTTEESPTVEINTPGKTTGNVPFDFHIAQGSEPTLVDIENTNPTPPAPTVIALLGVIDNPIGQTIIKNAGGDITSGGSADFVRTNTLDIEASGSVGTAADRIYVQLVQSTNPLTSAVRYTFLTAAATTGSVYLDLTGIERIPAGGSSSPFTIYADSTSAGQDVNVLLESSLLETGTATLVGGINVEVVNLSSGNSETNGDYATFFHPPTQNDNAATTLLDSGIFIDPSLTVTFASLYDFRHYVGGAAGGHSGIDGRRQHYCRARFFRSQDSHTAYDRHHRHHRLDRRNRRDRLHRHDDQRLHQLHRVRRHPDADRLAQFHRQRRGWARREFRQKLDFTSESIDGLDEILVLVGESPELDVDFEVRLWGSYLGEVLRRRYAGVWEMTSIPAERWRCRRWRCAARACFH